MAQLDDQKFLGSVTVTGQVVSNYAFPLGVGAAQGAANFSVPNNPANSSPALANFNNPLELGGRYYSALDDNSACVYLGALCAKSGGPILSILNSYGNIGGSEHSVMDVNWNGDTKIGGSLYVGQLGGSSGRVISPDYLYLDALNTQIVSNHGANTNNIVEWYSGVGFALKASLSTAGGLVATSATLSDVLAVELGTTSRIRWGGGNYIANNPGTGCLTNTSGYESSIASGNVAYQTLTGAKLSLGTGAPVGSTLEFNAATTTLYNSGGGFRTGSGAVVQFDGVGSGDTGCYLYRSAADTIKTPGALAADGSITTPVFGVGTTFLLRGGTTATPTALFLQTVGHTNVMTASDSTGNVDFPISMSAGSVDSPGRITSAVSGGGAAFYASGGGLFQSSASWIGLSVVANGASAIAFDYTAYNTLSTAGSLLAAWRNGVTTSPVVQFENDGGLSILGAGSIWVKSGQGVFLNSAGTHRIYDDAGVVGVNTNFRTYGNVDVVAGAGGPGAISAVDDIETTTIGKGFILKSPDGTRYRITVANGGALSTVAA